MLVLLAIIWCLQRRQRVLLQLLSFFLIFFLFYYLANIVLIDEGGFKNVRGRLLTSVCSNRTGGTCFILTDYRFRLEKWKDFLLWLWWNSGIGGSEKWGASSQVFKTKLDGAGTKWSLKSLPTQIIQWFYHTDSLSIYVCKIFRTTKTLKLV